MAGNQKSTDKKRPDDSFATNKKIPKSSWLFIVLISIALFLVVCGAFVVYLKVTANNTA